MFALYARLFIALFAVAASSALASWLPLSATARQRLDLVADGDGRLETPGWYALIENAWAAEQKQQHVSLDNQPIFKTPIISGEKFSLDQWHQVVCSVKEQADEKFDVIEDGFDIKDWPKRGGLCVIKGYLQQTQRITIGRPGSYGDQLTRWAILIPHGQIESQVSSSDIKQSDLKKATSEDLIVLVDLVDPQGRYIHWQPNTHTPVGVMARFHKQVNLPAQTGQVESFGSFVGHSPVWIQDKHDMTQTPLASQLVVVLGVVVVGGLGLLLIWRFKRLVRPSAQACLAKRKGAGGDLHESQLPVSRTDLPDDPAEALRVLESE